jgi:collagenase-like PrtC family protease
MKLTLGPVLFNWPAAIWRDFYFRMADEAPVDTVVVGEIVCSKRAPFVAPEMPAVIERLRNAGKEVLLGSLILVTLERERRATAELAAIDGLGVEANDMSCLSGLNGRPHAIGPFLQVYNAATAFYFAGRGATRICLPPELPAASIATIALALPNVMTEVFAFGRVPLAISARCYHARLAGLSKDNCRFVCQEDADGLDVETLDGEPFLAINGVQTLSHGCTNLLGDLAELAAMGVGAVRLSPQSCDMVAVARAFRDVLDGRLEVGDGLETLARVVAPARFLNGFLHGRPGVEWIDPVRPPQPTAGAGDRGCGRPSAR